MIAIVQSEHVPNIEYAYLRTQFETASRVLEILLLMGLCGTVPFLGSHVTMHCARNDPKNRLMAQVVGLLLQTPSIVDRRPPVIVDCRVSR